MKDSVNYRLRKQRLTLYAIFAVLTLLFCAAAFYITLIALGFAVLSGAGTPQVHRVLVLVLSMLLAIAVVGLLPLISALVDNRN